MLQSFRFNLFDPFNSAVLLTLCTELQYLSYAEKNRKEWEVRGEEIVAEMFAKYFPEKQLKNPPAMHLVCPSQA